MDNPSITAACIIGILLTFTYIALRQSQRLKCPACKKSSGLYKHPMVSGAVVCRYCRLRVR